MSSFLFENNKEVKWETIYPLQSSSGKMPDGQIWLRFCGNRGNK